uniref:HTH psq-type domain-containing protein n=2 Tax=Clytia hemisphaerica TaxID=252671 RepID=A0A7M5WZ09_9CNID
MGRTYKRKLESKANRQYNPAKLERAIHAVKSNAMKCGPAAKHYGVPYTTLYNKVKGTYSLKPGGQPRLSQATEEFLAGLVVDMAEWKIPMQPIDLRLLVQEYLNRQNVVD